MIYRLYVRLYIFVRMKKVFPAIVILILLSLLGLIVIEVSWFKNLLQVQEQRLRFNVEKAALRVAEDLSKQASVGPVTKLKRRPIIPLDDNFAYRLQPATISQRFTVDQIYQKLQQAF